MSAPTTRRARPEIESLGPYVGSDGREYEVVVTLMHTEYRTVRDGQWNRAKGPGSRSYRTRCGQELNPPREDGSFVTFEGVVLTPAGG